MKIDLKKEATFYKEQVIDNLQLMCSIANDVPPFEEIQFDIQTCDQINFSQFEMNDVIYVLRINNFSKEFSNVRFCEVISQLKKTKSVKYKLPKVNMEYAINENSILYVGKSSGLFSTRLKNHCCDLSDKTYSLQLFHLKSLPKLPHLTFTLYYTKVDFDKHGITEHNQKKGLLELLETSLHHHYKPLLGRTGH